MYYPDLKKMKSSFLERLKKWDIDETQELIVAKARKMREGRVGYYSSMSQFRSRSRIVVDVESIHHNFVKNGGIAPSNSLFDEEVEKTIAHEYGHIMAEAIRHLRKMGDPFDVPDWQLVFNDEEHFAEEFANFFICYESCYEDFFDQFMADYAKEFNRIFLKNDVSNVKYFSVGVSP